MFYERLQRLCEAKNISVTKMLKDLGLSTGSMSNWKKGQLPKGDVLILLAQYLDTSIDYLLCGNYKTGLSDYENRLIKIYSLTPERAKYKVLCDMERIINEEIEKLLSETEN